MKLSELHPEQVPDWWQRIRDDIASCCEHSGGKYEAVDILTAALAGRMSVWLALDDEGRHRALAITEIIRYPRCTVCALLACTGEDAPQWLDLIRGIEAWALDRGCRTVEPRCRPGWERLLKPLGYRKTHVILEKSLCCT